MKVQQVNNYQTNFKSGIAAQKGTVEMIKRIYPDFALALKHEADLVDVREGLHGLDFMWFAESKRALADKISGALSLPPSMEEGFFADSLMEPNTMDTLVDLSRHLYEA